MNQSNRLVAEHDRRVCTAVLQRRNDMIVNENENENEQDQDQDQDEPESDPRHQQQQEGNDTVLLLPAQLMPRRYIEIGKSTTGGSSFRQKLKQREDDNNTTNVVTGGKIIRGWRLEETSTTMMECLTRDEAFLVLKTRSMVFGHFGFFTGKGI